MIFFHSSNDCAQWCVDKNSLKVSCESPSMFDVLKCHNLTLKFITLSPIHIRFDSSNFIVALVVRRASLIQFEKKIKLLKMSKNSIFLSLSSLMLFIMIFECKIISNRWFIIILYLSIKFFFLKFNWFIVASARECTTGPNETFIKGGKPCQTTCAGLKQHCCVNYFKAPDACYCDEGFARRNPDNQCIPIDSSECQQQVLPEEPQNCDARPSADSF